MNIFFLLSLAFFSYPSFGFADLKEELLQRTSAGSVSLSYSAARVKMFNVIDLKKDDRGYFVMDVYCQQKVYQYQSGQSVGTKIPDPKVMNTEHTWPQSKFGESASIKKTDLHHLYPTLSKINAERGNFPFADVSGGKGTSREELSHLGKPENGASSGTFFEPPTDHKGNLARSLFYFSIRYKMALDPIQEYFMRQWHILDPVDSQEKKRNEEIFKIQKNRNPFIDEPALVNQVLDF